MKFSDLPLGARFILNGNECIKKSTRTLYMVRWSRTFYAGQNELCKPI